MGWLRITMAKSDFEKLPPATQSAIQRMNSDADSFDPLSYLHPESVEVREEALMANTDERGMK